MTDESDIDTMEQTALANDDEGGEEDSYTDCSQCGRTFRQPREYHLCDDCVAENDRERSLDLHIAAEDE